MWWRTFPLIFLLDILPGHSIISACSHPKLSHTNVLSCAFHVLWIYTSYPSASTSSASKPSPLSKVHFGIHGWCAKLSPDIIFWHTMSPLLWGQKTWLGLGKDSWRVVSTSIGMWTLKKLWEKMTEVCLYSFTSTDWLSTEGAREMICHVPTATFSNQG